MKALGTLLLIFFAGAAALAQNPNQNDKVDAFKMGIVMVNSDTRIENTKTFTIDTETSVARLYKFKNARVKKELAFIIKTNYGKLA